MRLAGLGMGIVGLLLAATTARAHRTHEKPVRSPLTVEETADAVLHAENTDDREALVRLAEREEPDPWLVADELRHRGAHEAAERFAERASTEGTGRLLAYVRSRRGTPVSRAAHEQLRMVERDLAQGRAESTLARLPAGVDAPGEVDEVRWLLLRGRALRLLTRYDDAEVALRKAGRAAADLGWLRAAALALGERAECARLAWSLPAAAARWEEALALEEQCGSRSRIAHALGELGTLLLDLGDGTRSLACHERALDLRTALGDELGRARSLSGIAIVHRSEGAYVKALAELETALTIFVALQDRRRVAISLGNIGCTHILRGDHARALTYVERSLALMEVLGDREGVARALVNIGGIHHATGELEAALAIQKRALVLKEELGELQGVAIALGNLGVIHGSLGHHGEALEYQIKALALHERLRTPAGIGTALRHIGRVYETLEEHRRALPYYLRALDVLEGIGDRPGVADVLGNLGNVHLFLGDIEWALALQRRSLALTREVGDRGGEAVALGNLGNVVRALGDYPRARALQEESLAIAKALGKRTAIGRALMNLGVIRMSQGEHRAAVGLLEGALEVFHEDRDRRFVSKTLFNLATCHRGLGNLAHALGHQQRCLELERKFGSRWGVARALGNLGTIRRGLGHLTEAVLLQRRALAVCEEVGDRDGAANALQGLAGTQLSLGDYAEALASLDRALRITREVGSREGTASVLGGMAVACFHLGDLDRALGLTKRALEIHTELGNRSMIAESLATLGVLHTDRRDFERARGCLERALEIRVDQGNRHREAIAIAALGHLHHRLGNASHALVLHERARETLRAAGDREGATHSLVNVGLMHEALGDRATALACLERAVDEAREINAGVAIPWALSAIADLHLEGESPPAALASARDAVLALRDLSGGLGVEQGAGARERFASVYVTGAAAAIAVGDVHACTWFLEAGRAASLLESLGGADALREFALPPELNTSLTESRLAERVATEGMRRARASGSMKEMRARRDALDAARETVRDVTHRIQREAKSAADLLFREPDDLDLMRAGLATGEALVLYALDRERALAVVATRSAARAVNLGAAAAIREAVSSLDADDPSADAPEIQAELKQLLVEPLGLDADVGRLLVSPHGALSTIPFALLTEAEVAYVPSGTAYRLLREAPRPQGKGVLALGDPDYLESTTSTAGSVCRSGELVPLPATRKEVEAIGDVLLLGEKATETELARAIDDRPRWRAIHLACHGLIDTERATLSSLALTPDPESDGFLTCLEVFRMRFPADLVVLSACETARGRVYRAEGIVGLTRAFMMAGAPRVLCSLWKVDDEATRALMERFYELWNPETGKGLGAAAALREAQAFVRNHEKWKHPYYWAAWVLWGLPD